MQQKAESLVYSISMHTYLRFSEVAQQCGFEVEGLLTYAGLKPDVQLRKSQRLPLECLLKVFDHGITHSRENWFPLALAESFSFDFFPEVETFLATSSNLKEASKLLHWLPHLILPELALELPQSSERLELKVRVAYATTSAKAVSLINGIEESIVCCILMFMKKLKLPLDGVSLLFSHAANTGISQLGMKLGVTIKTQTEFSGLCGPNRLWEHPIARQNSPIHSQTELMIEEVVARLQRQQSMSEWIKRELRNLPSLTLGEIAERLGLSLRGVQRQLLNEETTFQKLQAQTLESMANHYLKSPQLDMESIALKLGFSDRHSFTRAYKRWTGLTPSQYRKLHMTKRL
jgi:AraC-like DNA-binding protein